MLIVCPDSGTTGSMIFKIRKTLSQLKHWPPALLLPLSAPSSDYWLSSLSRKDRPGWPTSDEGQLLFGISRIFSSVTNSLIRSTNSGWRSECWKPRKTDQKGCSVASESSPYAEFVRHCTTYCDFRGTELACPGLLKYSREKLVGKRRTAREIMYRK